MKKSLLPLLFLVCPAMQLSAVTLLVDFGPTATVTTSPTWNSFTGTASAVPLALNDTSGVSTGYSITLAGGTVSQDNNNTAPVNQFSPFTPADVTRDFIFATGTRTLTLSGLDPLLSYDLTFYAYADRTGTRLTRFAVGSLSNTVEPAFRETNGTGGGVVTLANNVPDASGNLVITVSSAAATNWILSGLQLTSVPEPSSLVIAGAFGLLPLLRRRRI